MQQFGIKSEGIKKVVRRILLTMIPGYVLMLAFGLGLAFFDSNNEGTEIDITAFISTFAISTLIICAVLYYMIKSQKALLSSFTITISDNTISRVQQNTPTITMYFGEVIKIVKAKNGTYVVCGKDKHNPIIIYPHMENAAQLEELLCNIKPIEQAVPKPYMKVLYPMYIAALLATVLYIQIGTNETIVNILRVLFLCLVGASALYFIRNKNTDKRMRVMGWIILVAFALGLLNLIVVNALGLTA